jgi:trigger factor
MCLAALVSRATVKDTDGNIIDTDEFFGPRPEEAPEEAPDQVADEEADEAAEGESQ